MQIWRQQSKMWAIFKREINSFFATPVAYVFIFIFLVLSGVCTFMFGNFFERGQADLMSFFNYHPWLYLFLVPALSMRTWSEERKSGSIELLMTLPITPFKAMLGKFLAAWFVLAICLALTSPLIITVNYLGQPDNGIIVAAYAGSFLMSGAFLAIGLCMSAVSKSQVVAFILAIVVCFLFVLMGSPIVINLFEFFSPAVVLDTIASLSFLTHFENMSKGVIALNNIAYFIVSIFFWLTVGYFVIEKKKAD